VAHFLSVSNLFAKGFVARNDLLASQVTLADARQREIQARNALDLARASYNRLLTRPLTNEVRLEVLTELPVEGDVTEWTMRAFRQRPELEVLKEQEKALHEHARSVRASALPSIGLSGSYLHLENSFLERDQVWVVGVVGSWNLFDSGLTRHKAKAVDKHAAAAASMRTEAMSAIALQVRGAWLEVQETHQRILVTREAVSQAGENLNVARDRYRAGTAINTEVLDAETLRVRSLGNHDNANYDSIMATLRLHRAVGDL
jgi:outer membrane protein TolC